MSSQKIVATEASPPKAILAWSSGKDSAMALYRVQKENLFEIAVLVTTVTEGFNRVSMHGVREELIDLQSNLLGIPLRKIPLPFPCPNATYEERLGAVIDEYRAQGVTHIWTVQRNQNTVSLFLVEDILVTRHSHVSYCPLPDPLPLGEGTGEGFARGPKGSG